MPPDPTFPPDTEPVPLPGNPLPDPFAIPVDDFPQPSASVPSEEPLAGEESAPLQVEELGTGLLDPRPDPPDPARNAG